MEIFGEKRRSAKNAEQNESEKRREERERRGLVKLKKEWNVSDETTGQNLRPQKRSVRVKRKKTGGGKKKKKRKREGKGERRVKEG